MRIQVKVPNSNGVAAGATATWSMPIGRRYHSLALQLTNLTAAQLTEIRILANGEVIHRYSGADRDKMNQFDRMTAADTNHILLIPFDRRGLYNQAGEEATAIQTGSQDPATGVAITDFKMEVDIDPAAVNPAIAVVASQSDNPTDKNRQGPGLIRRVMKYTRVFSVAGVNEISDFPKGTEGSKFIWVNRAFFKTANTLDVEIDRSNFAIFQRTAALNNQVQTNGVRTPQTGWFVFDPTEEGYDWEPVGLLQANGIPYQDFRYKLNVSAGETITGYIEYLGKFQGN